MMEKYKEVEIGNARVIYKKSQIRDIDVVSTLKYVDDFIDKNPKLTRATDSSFIYFLDNKSEICHVGKEVIGFCSSDFLEDFELSSMDLSSSTICSFDFTKDIDIDSILNREKIIRQTASFLPMWRVRISGKGGQLIQLEFWKS